MTKSLSDPWTYDLNIFISLAQQAMAMQQQVLPQPFRPQQMFPQQQLPQLAQWGGWTQAWLAKRPVLQAPPQNLPPRAS